MRSKARTCRWRKCRSSRASPTKLELAASVDDIDQKRADIELAFPAAIPARMVPKEGDKINFEGTPVSYTPSPFVMVMEKGALLTKAAPAADAGSHQFARSRSRPVIASAYEKAAPGAALIFADFLRPWQVPCVLCGQVLIFANEAT